MTETVSFEETIKPFFYVEHDDQASVCLYAGQYKNELFAQHANESFSGNGYDWESLAIAFINEKMPAFEETISFDSEAGMFCAYAEDFNALKKFALAFKAVCDNDHLIRKLFALTEPG